MHGMRIAHPRSIFSLSRHSHFSPRSLQPPRTLNLLRVLGRSSMEETESADAAEDEDAVFGFKRREMYSGNLAGTIDPYDRHLFLCFKKPSEWLSRVEKSEADLLPMLLSSALKARKADLAVKTKMTICEGREGTAFEDGDVLIFPEMIKYKGLKDLNVSAFVDNVLVNGKPWASGVQEVMTGSHIFVCAHGSRDKRCGVCGPVLIESLKEGIESRGLQDQVFVTACSHVGGHKYAGNLIVYSPDPEGNIMGHWYGYVTPLDVPQILDKHIGEREVIKRIWRGQMGAISEDGGKPAENKLPNGNAKKSKEHQESNTEVGKDSGCCQGAKGFSCCRGGLEGNLEKAMENTESSWKEGAE